MPAAMLWLRQPRSGTALALSWVTSDESKLEMSSVPLMLLEQLQDGQHDVIDVAESRGLRLLGMVHAACKWEAHCFRKPARVLRSSAHKQKRVSAYYQDAMTTSGNESGSE